MRDGGAAALWGASSVAAVQIGDGHYALVTAERDNGLQIIDITSPKSPTLAASVTSSSNPALRRASSVATAQIGDGHYALVASEAGHALQIIDITNPKSPTLEARVADGSDYPTLRGIRSVATAQIGDGHYALVASNLDNGLQIIDITNPDNPSHAASVTDGRDYPTLRGASSVATTQIGDGHYALVASEGDNGLQIIDITNPDNPSHAASVTDGRDYPTLRGARSVTTTQIGDGHYALVASSLDDGLQIIDITDPYNPSPTASVTDGRDYPHALGSQLCRRGPDRIPPLRPCFLLKRRRPPDGGHHIPGLPA